MEFWDTVKAAIVANLVALLIAPALWISIIAAVRKYGDPWRENLSRFVLKISLNTRFSWLVLTGKKYREEHGSWLSAETNRRLALGLVVQAPYATSQLTKSAAFALSMMSKWDLEMARPSYARKMLSDALGSMTPNDFETLSERPSLSVPPHDRAEWLCSQPYSRLALWALFLNAQDQSLGAIGSLHLGPLQRLKTHWKATKQENVNPR